MESDGGGGVPQKHADIPVPRVVNRLGSATVLPANRPILLQESLERRAAGATVQPDSDFVGGVWVLRREEPEVKLRSLVGLVTNGKQTWKPSATTTSAIKT